MESKAKVHYAGCDEATESDTTTYWYTSLCGLEYTESPFTKRENEVTCKSCLKVLKKHNTLNPKN